MKGGHREREVWKWPKRNTWRKKYTMKHWKSERKGAESRRLHQKWFISSEHDSKKLHGDEMSKRMRMKKVCLPTVHTDQVATCGRKVKDLSQYLMCFKLYHSIYLILHYYRKPYVCLENIMWNLNLSCRELAGYQSIVIWVWRHKYAGRLARLQPTVATDGR